MNQIPDEVRRSGGGGICPLCRDGQDKGIPHPCITKVHNPRWKPELTTTEGHALLDELRRHPSRPVYEDGDMSFIRIVDRTWCFCQCAGVPKETGVSSP